MKILAVDYGERRVGLAVGMTDLKMTFPREALDQKKTDVIASIGKLAKEESAGRIVMGMPTKPDGSKHEKEKPIKEFARKLRDKTGLDVVFQDEAFSTVEAKEKTKHFSTKRKKADKASLDSAAAAVILQNYLDDHF